VACDDDAISNPTCNSSFEDVLAHAISRRGVLKAGAGSAALAFLAGSPSAARAATGGFTPVPVSTADAVMVPPEFEAEVLYAWGDPISDGPAFLPDASNTAADQEQQAGMHHDGMHFFALEREGERTTRGLLVVNHEYTDDGLLHPDGMLTWSADKVRKSQAAHGVSVIELTLRGDRWEVVRPSRYARRVTGYTPCRISGPAAGATALRTSADPAGRTVLGTLNNCAHGHTPWGTYLTCEENFNGYFVNASGAPASADQARYGLGAGFGYRWHEHDARFDLAVEPNEANRFGWVVELDPFDPEAAPVKRTALGRFKHEGAWVVVASDLRVVVYMGDDERGEYVYKFVSKLPWPAARLRRRSPLDEGTLYVARFDAGATSGDALGTGRWLELTYGKNGLDATNGFTSQADVVTFARRAADVVGATRMDRPEWIALHPNTREVYCTLTNNSRRGTTFPVDEANPRANNVFGHILRWRESGSDPRAKSFKWDVFVLCGDPTNADPNKQGNIVGDAFGSPDGLWFDDDGRLWIQTDISTSALNQGDYANIGNNQMLCADVESGEIRRFLTGPSGCEVTGVIWTPDKRTLFVNIQHPGEPASERNDPADPKALSSWPDGPSGGRPRAATLAIRRRDREPI
jgi:hypothetical protein